MKHLQALRPAGLFVIFISVLTIALAPAPLAGWDPASVHDTAARDAFAARHLTKAALPPFAFVYGGKQARGVVGKWQVTSEEKTDGAKLVRTVVYTDPSTGLRITAVYTVYKDFPAAEWVVRFKNTGRAPTPIIEEVRACAAAFLEFADAASGPVTLYRARGSSAARSDFGPIEEALAALGQGPLRPDGRPVLRHERAALLQRRVAHPRRRRRHRLERALGGDRQSRHRGERPRGRPHRRDGRDALQAPARRRGPDAVDRAPLLEEPRPDGRAQPLPPLHPGPPHAADRRQAHAAPDQPRRRLRRAVPLQRVRLRHRELRHRHDRAAPPVRPRPRRLLDRRRLVREPDQPVVVGGGHLDGQPQELPARPQAGDRGGPQIRPGLRRLVRARARLRRDVARPRAQRLADRSSPATPTACSTSAIRPR